MYFKFHLHTFIPYNIKWLLLITESLLRGTKWDFKVKTVYVSSLEGLKHCKCQGLCLLQYMPVFSLQIISRFATIRGPT